MREKNKKKTLRDGLAILKSHPSKSTEQNSARTRSAAASCINSWNRNLELCSQKKFWGFSDFSKEIIQVSSPGKILVNEAKFQGQIVWCSAAALELLQDKLQLELHVHKINNLGSSPVRDTLRGPKLTPGFEIPPRKMPPYDRSNHLNTTSSQVYL